MPPFWWGGIFTRTRYLSGTKPSRGRLFQDHARADPPPTAPGISLFAPARREPFPAGERLMKDTSERGRCSTRNRSSIGYAERCGTFQRCHGLTELKIGTSAGWRVSWQRALDSEISVASLCLRVL